MKKQYITPASTLLDLLATAAILATSKEINPDGSEKQEIEKDQSGTGGWAGSKGNSFGEWDADED